MSVLPPLEAMPTVFEIAKAKGPFSPRLVSFRSFWAPEL